MDTRLNVIAYPPLCAVLFGVRHRPHCQFYAVREQLGNLGLGRKFDSTGQAVRLCHLAEILAHRDIGTEMQIVLQPVAVGVPHTVEIAGSEPFGLEYLLGAGTTDGVQQQTLELVVVDAVLFARTDIVVVVPELVGYFLAAHTFQQPSAVLHGRPFQHTADRHVEHDRVVVLQDSRVENTRLAQAHPTSDGRVGDDPLCRHLGQPVVVVRRYAYRVACTPPMERLAAVAHLCHAAYIDHARLLVALCQYGIADIGRRSDVGLAGGGGTVVGLRRYHSAHMQYDVAARYAFQYVLIACQVAPYYLHAVGKRCQQRFVFCARTRQYAQCISFGVAQYLLHTRIPHSARSTG